MTHARNTAKSAAPIIKTLAQRFPAAFVANKFEPHRPLAHGIREQIRALCPELGRRKIANSLFFYTGRLKYREALIEGVPRVDIDGHPVGVVNHDEAEHAAARVAAEKERPNSQPTGISGLKLVAQQRKNGSK
jgi:sRNA-binding protein